MLKARRDDGSAHTATLGAKRDAHLVDEELGYRLVRMEVVNAGRKYDDFSVLGSDRDVVARIREEFCRCALIHGLVEDSFSAVC